MGMPGVGFWRGVAQKVRHTWTRKRKGCEVLGHTDLKFQSLIDNVVNISDRQQHCSSASQ